MKRAAEDPRERGRERDTFIPTDREIQREGERKRQTDRQGETKEGRAGDGERDRDEQR